MRSGYAYIFPMKKSIPLKQSPKMIGQHMKLLQLASAAARWSGVSPALRKRRMRELAIAGWVKRRKKKEIAEINSMLDAI
jgi:hypothetical protein